MSSEDMVIDIAGVSKVFNIFEKPSDRLLQMLMPRIGRVVPGKAAWATRQRGREFWALRNVSLSVKRGDAVGIIGRNGSGKSTLLQIIAGTLAPTTGTAQVNGRIAALLELGSGFNPDFTGRENVILNGMILGLSEREVMERFDAIAGFADIGNFIDQPVRTYSSGMMLRLAFAVQTQVEPDILIVDEALAVGDALFQKRCFQQMEALRANGCTLLLVSHDQESIRTLTDHSILLRDGLVHAAGPSSDVVLEYRKQLHEDERAYYASVSAQHVQQAQQAVALRASEVAAASAAAAAAAGTVEVGLSDGPDDFDGSSPPASVEIAEPVLAARSDALSFGDFDCVIERVRVLDGAGDECSYFLPRDRVIIEVVSRPARDMTNLNVNIRLRNKEGVKLYSWGTLNQDMQQWSEVDAQAVGVWDRHFIADQPFTVRFEFVCALGMNFYEVQASVSEEVDRHGGAQRMLHWRDEAAFFQVGMRAKEYTFGGVCDLQMRAAVLDLT